MIFRCYTGKSEFLDVEAVNEDLARYSCLMQGFNVIGVAALDADNKPFDITKHEFSDDECVLDNSPIKGECLRFYCQSSLDDDGCHYGFEHNRDDAIAIARHFNLTEDDLK